MCCIYNAHSIGSVRLPVLSLSLKHHSLRARQSQHHCALPPSHQTSSNRTPEGRRLSRRLRALAQPIGLGSSISSRARSARSPKLWKSASCLSNHGCLRTPGGCIAVPVPGNPTHWMCPRFARHGMFFANAIVSRTQARPTNTCFSLCTVQMPPQVENAPAELGV